MHLIVPVAKYTWHVVQKPSQSKLARSKLHRRCTYVDKRLWISVLYRELCPRSGMYIYGLRDKVSELWNLKTQGKFIENWCLFRLNFEDEEANYDSFWVFTLIECHTDRTINLVNMFIRNSGLLNLKSVVVDEGASSSEIRPMELASSYSNHFSMILSKKYETIFAN